MNHKVKFIDFVGRALLSMGIGYMIGYVIGAVTGMSVYNSLVLGSVLSIAISIPLAMQPYLAKGKETQLELTV